MKVKAFRESLLGEKGMQIILGSFALFVTLPIDSASDTDLNIPNKPSATLIVRPSNVTLCAFLYVFLVGNRKAVVSRAMAGSRFGQMSWNEVESGE